MKKINKLVLGIACATNTVLWMGCSDEFLREKTVYGTFSPIIYNDYAAATKRVDDIYLLLLPDANGTVSYKSPSVGKSDIQSQSTEEFSGLSDFVNPDVDLTTTNKLPDWFHVQKASNAGPWGLIRNCNDAIEGIKKGTLPDEQKQELLGQVYFFRAWQYYMFVKTYGGVPIVDHVQAADVSEAQNLAVPRSTTKECIDWICNELETAAAILPVKAPEFGRITKGAALALAGRARLLYASPLFNRGDDAARWQLAYNANKAAADSLGASGFFGLAYENAPGVNASGWSKMFSDFNSEEAVFVTLYNKLIDDGGSNDIWRNNRWEQSIRPKNAGTTSGGMNTTGLMVDLFPMKDGKKPGISTTYPYSTDAEKLTFFKDRDPRFYRTFTFPGEYWRFEGDPTSLGVDYPYAGLNYVLWNYAWYKEPTKQADTKQSGFGADGLGLDYKGVYLRKRSNDFDMTTPTPTCLYTWTEVPGKNGRFASGAMPYMEIRYAEVLLNLAEAACGINNPTEAIDILKRIRKRAGYTNDAEDYGLDVAGLTGDRGKLFGAILYERQIELAYEGKRFDDMRRWLLWDGGTNFSAVDGAPDSWHLNGKFGNNTCTYLGVAPFNGSRRDHLELHAQSTDSAEAQGKDPIIGYRPTPLDLKVDLATQTTEVATLENFYTTRLKRKVRQGDEEGKAVAFKPKYYFIGFTSGAQTNNITLKQTIGWADVMNGSANGTFDPLAE